MARTQVLNVVIITSLNRKDFKMWKDKGRGSRIWLICCSNELTEVLKLSCRSVEGQQALVFIMEASSESTGSSTPANFVEADIREIKRDVMVLQRQVEAIDTEGGRRLENVDKDLVFLRKQIKWAVKQAENVVIGLIAELEIKVDKLALKFVKLEAATKPIPLSRSYENIK